MSFSIQRAARTKAEVLALLKADLAVIAQEQPIHTKDHDAALAVAEVYLDLFDANPDKDVMLILTGSMQEETESLPEAYTHSIREIKVNMISVSCSIFAAVRSPT